jgi:valyl-tRNA synthetase
LRSVEGKLNNEKFVNNAPPAVLDGERKKQADALERIKLLEEKLTSLN